MSEIVRRRIMSVNPNETKQLFDLMYDIRDRTTRIETETSRLKHIEKKADNAESIASEALYKSNTNARELERAQSNVKWLWGTALTIVGIVLSVVGVLIKIIV